ncbi:MAG: 30S ribosomal protein S21 [Patescibacteria group bacterium]
MVEVKKRQGESSSVLLYRFSKRIKQSGVLKEAKKRRFHGRAVSRRRRLLSALHRQKKSVEIAALKRKGLF